MSTGEQDYWEYPLHDLLPMLAVLGQELGGGDEHRAAQARVRVRAGLLDRQPAEAIGQGLGRSSHALLCPGRLGQRAVRVEGDGLALDVDLPCGFPVPADRGVTEARVVGGHDVGVVVENPPDHFLGDVAVDQSGA